MKKLLCLAFLLFVGSFFGAKKAAAIVGHASQLVDNERVMSEKGDFKKTLGLKKAWPKLSPEKDELLGDRAIRLSTKLFWTAVLLGVFAWVAFFVRYWLLVDMALLFGALLMLFAFTFAVIGLSRKTNFKRTAIINLCISLLCWLAPLVVVIVILQGEH